MKIYCYRNNKRVLEIELNIAEETLKKQLENGTLVYHTSKGIEIVNLRNFDRIEILGMSLEKQIDLFKGV